ncbi:MAG: hypothetical protein EBT63_06725 [Proteobacteria bacterium]|nr:hypothetical protein [Pseudomonadota bacterium]
MRETADKSPFKIGAVLNAPNTLLEGAIYTFTEKKNDPEGSQLITLKLENGKLTQATNQNGEIITTTDPTKTKNYAVNGIDTGFESAVENYFEKNGNPTELTLRHNPTHGPLGDLMESGLGKIADWTGLENTIAMNRIVAEDMFDRRNIDSATNLFHSQGTIIGKGAMEAYADANQINQTQQFVAVGPAVLEGDWISAVNNLNLNTDRNSKEYLNFAYTHDPKDPVRYLTVPSNAINQAAALFGQKDFNSPIYIPNLFEIPVGLWNLQNMNKHSITNSDYSKFLQPSSEQSSQNPSTAPPR